MKKSQSTSCIDGAKAILSIVLFFVIAINMAWAQNFPTNFAGVQIATGLDAVGMDIAPDGRIFIAEKDGRIRIIKNDVILSTSFTKLTGVDVDGERGFQKVLIDPNFNSNHYLYVYYTHKSGSSSANRVSRLTANGDVMVSGSEKVLIDMPSLGSSKFHNGGGLAIKDGKLYISVGENTISNFAQSMETVKGKILRINTDGSIPTDNPFYNSTSGQNKAIWALGFRNPFRLSVQAGTGKIYANDVGASSYEEINEVLKGKNYGWPTIEGKRTNQTAPANYVDPVYAYSHSSGCAITAGTFYSPTTARFPSQYVGKFFFGDYCNDWIKTFDPETKAVANFATNVNRPLDVLVSSDGRMYFLSRGDGDNTSSSGGVLWKVNYTGNGIPVIAVQPKSQSVSVGQVVTFTVQASGTPTPTFQWQRNGTNISNATSASYTLQNPSLNDSGAKFKVKVSNSEGSITSSEATLTVINNDKPVATITSPSSGSKYRAGDVITFSGTGTDAEDGNLPATAFTWKIDLYHFDDPAHSHPAMDAISGFKSSTFTVPVEMETSPNVLFRIFLTVVDSKGATHTVSRDITPITADITLSTNPAGLNLKLDGRVVTAPYTFTGASGVLRSIEAVSSQTAGGKTYVFSSWSDGGAKEHSIFIPGTNTTITANFVEGSEGIPAGYTFSANENQTVNVTGTMNIAYGANGQYKYLYNQTSNVGCTNAVFGDPIPGTVKKCYVQTVTSVAPSVSFDTPASGATLAVGSNLYVKVNAADADGSIANVKLYLHNTLVRQESYAPYEWGAAGQNDALLTNLAAGSYTLKAVATDNDNNPGEATRQFTVASASGNKIVHMTYRTAPAFALDGGADAVNNSPLFLWDAQLNNANQQWTEIDRGGGYYSYQKVNTNFCIDGGSGGAKDQPVKMYTCSDASQNQQWQKVSMGGDYYMLKKRNAIGYALDGGGAGARNQNTLLWTVSNSNYNQHWKLTTISGSNNTSAARLGSTEESLTDVSQEEADDNVIRAYPNPSSSDGFTIDFNGKMIAAVSIYGMDSKRVYNKVLDGRTSSLKVEMPLKAGMYIIKVADTSGKVYAKKIAVN